MKKVKFQRKRKTKEVTVSSNDTKKLEQEINELRQKLNRLKSEHKKELDEAVSNLKKVLSDKNVEIEILKKENSELKDKIEESKEKYLKQELGERLKALVDKITPLENLVTAVSFEELDEWQKALTSKVTSSNSVAVLNEVKKICEDYKQLMTVAYGNDVVEMRPGYWNGVDIILEKLNSIPTDETSLNNDVDKLVAIISQLKKYVVATVDDNEVDTLFSDAFDDQTDIDNVKKELGE